MYHWHWFIIMNNYLLHQNLVINIYKWKFIIFLILELIQIFTYSLSHFQPIVINCGENDNEVGLKFTNLSAAKVSGIRGKHLQLVCSGQDSKDDALRYEWLFNGNPIKEDDSRFVRRQNGTVLEVRKLYLVIKNASKSTGKYNCLISNSIGTIISRNIFLISTTPRKSPFLFISAICNQAFSFYHLNQTVLIKEYS